MISHSEEHVRQVAKLNERLKIFLRQLEKEGHTITDVVYIATKLLEVILSTMDDPKSMAILIIRSIMREFKINRHDIEIPS